jgi:alpha-L-rhamnosidase
MRLPGQPRGAAFYSLAALASLLALPFGASRGLRAPTELRCEYEANPVGLDELSPRLSWQVTDDRRGARQTAYQVLVADSLDALKRDRGTLWDSGKTNSGESVWIVYEGRPLVSRQRCFWKVRTWDQTGKPSPYSKPAHWEMGLLEPEDWQAQWITMAGSPDAPRLGQWIWHPTEQSSGSQVFLRKEFSLEEDVAKAEVRCTADNRIAVSVNTQEIGRHDNWKSLALHDVTSTLHKGANVIAVRAANDDGPCGALFAMHIELRSGRTLDILSDSTWQCNTEERGNWTEPGFRDPSWGNAAVIAEYGAPPWGRHDGAGPASMCLRKEFPLTRNIARARAYVTGLGLYELWINGQRVGDDVFAPGWTHYGKRVQYRVFDVTSLLREGPNAVGAVLGEGWFAGRIAQRTPPEGGTSALRFLLQLEVEYADGARVLLATDPSWRAHPGSITQNDFYDGETYDAGLETPGWMEPAYDESAWQPTRVLHEPGGRPVAQVGPSIRVTDELPTKTVTQPSPGAYVFDFGQNAVGWARLKVKAPAGTRVQIRFAEVLNPDGTLYTDNYRSAKATDVYTCRGDGEETWEPTFTYRGFRYAELTGFPGEPPADALTMCVANSAPDWIGEFECSNDLLNRIQHNIRWGQRSNLHSVPTDCPQRDERLGWTGDALCFAPTAGWNMDMRGFFRKWLRDLTDSQGPAGEVSDVAPIERPHGPASPAWGDVIAVVPWHMYLVSGDRRILEENYEAVKAWVQYMRVHAPNHLYEREGYGDWIAPVDSPKKPIGAAYYYLSTRTLADMAEVLGRDDDAREYARLAAEIADAFNATYLDRPTASYPGGTQTANLLPLAFGVVPDARREAVAASVARDIEARDTHLSTGFLGTAYLLPALTATGHHELAYRLASQRTYPSWGYMVEKDATTIWELWNSDTAGPGMNSRNHFALGAVGQWFYEALAGIVPDPRHPGFRRFTLRPRPAGDLAWVKASYRSPYGTIRSEWRRTGAELAFHAVIPANTSAEVWVPTLGKSAPSVTEGGRPVLHNGAAAESSPGLRFVRLEAGFVVFEAAAGEYDFTVAGR